MREIRFSLKGQAGFERRRIEWYYNEEPSDEDFMSQNISGTCEVIGNIYDNSELLNKEKVMNNWDDIVMLDGNSLPVNNVDRAYFVFIKTKAGYDSFISESKQLNCSTYGIEQPDEESIAEKVLNQGFIWNYPTCSYIPLSKFLEKEFNTIHKYGDIIYDCVTKYVGKFKGENK